MSKTREISKKRIEKEKETLAGLDHNLYKVNFSEDDSVIEVQINGKKNESYSFNIVLSDTYPFQEPKVKLNLLPNQETLIDTTEQKPLETFLKKPWTPNITWRIMILSIHRYMESHIKTKQSEKEDPTLFEIFQNLCQKKKTTTALFIVFLISLMYRVLCSFGGYSGVNDPPTFGDYEAQRHWMELTVNLHPSEWYVETPDNDLTYWRIDYPPMSAYISYLCGVISRFIDPASMELFKSRGYETPLHKLFMRGSVLVCDVLILITAIIAFVIKANNKYNFQTKLTYIFLILMTPLLILIDHGHFQYNCATLGLTLWAVYFCGTNMIWLGSIFFSLALNVKQMALYYALPFFCFILGKLYRSANLNVQTPGSQAFKWVQFFFQILQVGGYVIGTMALVWAPWLTSLNNFLDVLKAIFPVKRGLYQLKVASFWCATDIIMKWQNRFPSELLVIISMALTLVASLPSAITLLRMPRLKYFSIALFNISMAFFFFSYHVHEKTILLPLMFFILNIRYFKHFYLDYIIVATFTNYHMLVEDKLTLQYFVFTLTYAYFAHSLLKKLKEGWSKPPKKEAQDKSTLKKIRIMIEEVYRRVISKVVIAGMIALTVLDKTVTPPAKYPYLFHLLFSLLGFGVFAITFIYSNLKMIESFQRDQAKEKVTQVFDKKEAMGKNE